MNLLCEESIGRAFLRGLAVSIATGIAAKLVELLISNAPPECEPPEEEAKAPKLKRAKW
jgi:hypothetical protein